MHPDWLAEMMDLSGVPEEEPEPEMNFIPGMLPSAFDEVESTIDLEGLAAAEDSTYALIEMQEELRAESDSEKH